LAHTLTKLCAGTQSISIKINNHYPVAGTPDAPC
jgi:hypothetical protein